MATAQDQALATINQKFADDQIDAETYQKLIAAVAEMSPAATQPVKKTAEKPTALNDPTRRQYVQVTVSDDFKFGHLILRKGEGRRFGVWAEDVTSVITQLMERFEDLPEDVRKAAEQTSEEE